MFSPCDHMPTCCLLFVSWNHDDFIGMSFVFILNLYWNLVLPNEKRLCINVRFQDKICLGIGTKYVVDNERCRCIVHVIFGFFNEIHFVISKKLNMLHNFIICYDFCLSLDKGKIVSTWWTINVWFF